MITCFFGLPGCGKSTMLAKIAQRELRRIEKGKSKYERVLSNYYIEGCQAFSFNMLGVYNISDSLILIDEITLDADSRDFKQFSKNLKEFFILHRHFGCDIVYATQQYDGVDRKIRELTHDLWYMKKFGSFTYATAIYRHITITEDSDIKVGYIFPNIFKFLFDLPHNLKLCYRPRYYQYFDSFDVPTYKHIDFAYYPMLRSRYHLKVQLYLFKCLVRDRLSAIRERRRSRARKAVISS